MLNIIEKWDFLFSQENRLKIVMQDLLDIVQTVSQEQFITGLEKNKKAKKLSHLQSWLKNKVAQYKGKKNYS